MVGHKNSMAVFINRFTSVPRLYLQYALDCKHTQYDCVISENIHTPTPSPMINGNFSRGLGVKS